MKRVAAVAALAGALAFAGPAGAQDLNTKQFKVAGTFGNLTNWTAIEKPFWADTMPKASGGKITAQATPFTELGLKGSELMRLVKLGVFDIVHALPIYFAEDPAIEGIDIAGLVKDFGTARKVADAYLPVLDDLLQKKYGAKILNHYSFPAQSFYCRGDVKTVADLKGKKVRVQGASQGDLVEGLGGTSVTITFAEVVPALEKGAVDCGITGTMPAYKAKWWQVTNTNFYMPVGYTIVVTAISLNSWNALNKPTQDFIAKQMKDFENHAWKTVEAESDEGIACNTGVGKCGQGDPAKLAHVKPSDADLKERDRILKEVVLKRFAQRCGADCTKKWNDTVGKIVGMQAGG